MTARKQSPDATVFASSASAAAFGGAATPGGPSSKPWRARTKRAQRPKLIDLRDYRLTFADGEDENPESVPEDVLRLRREVGSAHGILLGTPEYHGSLSGVLKNALDLMGFDEFEGKMIGLIGVSGGQSVLSMPSIRCGTLGARCTPGWCRNRSPSRRLRIFSQPPVGIRDVDIRERLQSASDDRVAEFARLHEGAGRKNSSRRGKRLGKPRRIELLKPPRPVLRPPPIAR